MKNLEKYKTIIIAAVVFTLAIAAYNYFGAGEVVSTGAEAQSIGTDLVELNKGLKAVTLDRAPLNTNLYRSLSDWSPALLSQPIGRENPFAPISQ